MKLKNYGLPYKGSKNAIAYKIANFLPKADILVDLFAGGCAITHATLLSHKYQKIITNDITKAPLFFKRALEGDRVVDEKRWISRDEFKALNYDDDILLRLLWSFGNNIKRYKYNKGIEPYKKAYHHAAFGDFSLFNEFAPYINGNSRLELRRSISRNIERVKADYLNWYLSKMRLNSVEINETLTAIKIQLLSFETFLALESLQNLERFNKISDFNIYFKQNSLFDFGYNLEVSQKSYELVELPSAKECVIYCDIPYKNTDKYLTDFNHDEFYNWAREKANQGYKIYISEYQMPDDFKEVFAVEKIRKFGNTKGIKTIEKIFTI